MDQRINFITLGVKDLARMKEFYQTVFGWETLKDSDGIVFFKLNGFILGLFPEHELASDIGVPHVPAFGFRGFTLAINYNSEAGVDQAFAELESRGVIVVKSPEHVFWGGYSGYVADVEGNYWELAYNPFLELDSEGNVVTHR